MLLEGRVDLADFVGNPIGFLLVSPCSVSLSIPSSFLFCAPRSVAPRLPFRWLWLGGPLRRRSARRNKESTFWRVIASNYAGLFSSVARLVVLGVLT